MQSRHELMDALYSSLNLFSAGLTAARPGRVLATLAIAQSK
jgi:hypothetical protein